MKAVKYIIVIIIIAVVGYNSVYFKKLDEVKASLSAKEFNAAAYAQTFWNNKLMPDTINAIEITQLTTLLSTDAAKTFDRYSHALGIGNLRYILVKGKGEITAINEDEVFVSLKTDTSSQAISIPVEYIFGNAIRDATGLIDINDFNNTMDFNNVSAELNKIAGKTVLPALRSIKKGDIIEFAGAIELNKEHLNLDKIEVAPMAIGIAHLVK